MERIPSEYVSCHLCPRACGANRAAGARGACGATATLRVARAALHFWEEPPISGEAGSGAIFFSACTLRCVFCQNAQISSGNFGADVSQEVTLYDFVGFKKKATFRAIGSATWIDHARFVFTKEDRSKGPRGASAPHQEGWVSVVVYDTAIEEEVPVMEATATKDYLLDGIDYEEGTMTIIERSVKDVKDWNDEQKVQDNVITAPFPAAG